MKRLVDSRRRAALLAAGALALQRPAAAAPAISPAISPAIAPAQSSAPADEDRIDPARRLRFPRDFGAHPGARTEWWYITGWLALQGRVQAKAEAGAETGADAATSPAALGFQITFFRSRTDVDPRHPSRFAARQLLFAHAALTDLRDASRPQLRHDERIARAGFGVAEASTADTALRLGNWTLVRSGAAPQGAPAGAHSHYRMQADSERGGFGFALDLSSTQPVLLQGEAGHSRKGPLPTQASHYYSQPQLATRGTVRVQGERLAVKGVAWMDHEWSETLLAPDAVGWDWIGMNLFDGRALTAFQLRRADGSALWAGGSVRAPGAGGPPSAGGIAVQAGRSFGPDELRFRAGRTWASPATGARYPVQWTVDTPLGRLQVRALLDAQELDSRGSTGSVYWEGLSELFDDGGRLLGRGYLEMTGYAARLQL